MTKHRHTRKHAPVIDSPWINRIVLGNCLDVLAQIDFPCVDLVHTSPPYNIDKPYSDFTDQRHLGNYLTFIALVAEQLSAKIRKGGSLFWQTGYTRADDKSDEINPIDLLTHPIFNGHGFYLKDRIIWRYYGGMSFKAKFKNQHETIYWYVKGVPGDVQSLPYFDVDEVREASREYDPRNNLLGRNPGNVWEVDRVAFGSAEQTSHIAVFPEEISERIVRACTRPGALVLDPFLGSGTVAKVARSLARRYIGIEISRRYHQEATHRLGYQQFGELDTVVSEWIKEYLLSVGGRRGRDEACAFVEEMLVTRLKDDEKHMLRRIADLESTRVLPKTRKPELWRMADEYVDNLGERVSLDRGPVSNAVRAYLRCYRLAKRFNGVRLLLLAQKIVEGIRREAATTDGLRNIVTRVVDGAPSTYEMRDSRAIILKESRRRIKVASSRKVKNTPAESLLFGTG